MHIHVYCHKLTDLPDRNHDFYQLVTSLFIISFEEGNRKIAQYILEKKLYSRNLNGQVSCFGHVELIMEKLHLPITANLFCHTCGMNRDYT